MKFYETIKDEIQALIEKHQFQEHEEIIHKELEFPVVLFHHTEMVYLKLYKGFKLEVAELIVFLQKCLGNEIKLTSTIKNPSDGEKSGFQIHHVLKSPQIAFEIIKWANTFLEWEQDGLYQSEFEWDLKPMDEKCHFYTEPYSNEELATIIRYEKKQLSEDLSLTQHPQNGKLASTIYFKLNKNDVFKSQQKNGKGKTKEYAFIFDIICILRKYPDNNEANKEKYDKVKGWIKAYQGIADKKDC